MLDAKLYSELSPQEQAAQPVGYRRSDSVRIVGTHSSAGYEPREFIRAAKETLQSQAVGHDVTTVAMKALALLRTGLSRVETLGAWAPPRRHYNPLPELLELQALAGERLGPPASGNKWIVRCRSAIEAVVADAKAGAAA